MSALCLQFDCYRKTLVLFVVVDSEDSDWLAWLYPSPYTAAYRFWHSYNGAQRRIYAF
jgi:hypothetical protein